MLLFELIRAKVARVLIKMTKRLIHSKMTNGHMESITLCYRTKHRLAEIHVEQIAWTIRIWLVTNIKIIKWFKRNSLLLNASRIFYKRWNKFRNSLWSQKENMYLAVMTDNFTGFEVRKLPSYPFKFKYFDLTQSLVLKYYSGFMAIVYCACN